MTIERFERAVKSGEQVVLTIPTLGSLRHTGTAAWTEADPDGTRRAGVRTDDGEILTAGWPSYRTVFTEAGERVNAAVACRDDASSIAGISGLDGIDAGTLVDALFDEVESCKFETGTAAFVDKLGRLRPEIAAHRRVKAAVEAAAEAAAAEEARAQAADDDKRKRIDAMTAVATGDADEKEARAIRSRIASCTRHTADGTARQVATRRFGRLPQLRSRKDLARLEGLAVPVGDGRHLIARRLVLVHWQESADEPDVCGTILACRGTRIDTEAAGKRNARKIRRVLKREKAIAALEAALDTSIPETEGLPQGAVEIAAARNTNARGYGTRYYLAAGSRLVRRFDEYYWPTKIVASSRPVKPATIAAGLGIARKAVPPPPKQPGRGKE